MASDAAQLAKEWDDRTDIKSFCDLSFDRIYKTIEFFHSLHYRQYVPTQGSGHQEFLRRFDNWLGNVGSDDDKRVLFEFAPQIIFFGREEFTELYHAAFRGPITRWVIDTLGLKLDDPQLQSRIDDELTHHTWYCPITDSMPISDFHHANDIGGVAFRPDFRSLAQFGDRDRVLEYMQNPTEPGKTAPTLRGIVLLEDFVGGGTQIEEAIEFAASLDPQIEVLFVPLVICPSGSQKARVGACGHANVHYEPVLELTEDLFINANSTPPHKSLESAVRDVVARTYNGVKGNDAANPRPYSPFGFPPPDGTGATVVMYSNTPANTLPIVQHASNTWNALFRRSARIR